MKRWLAISTLLFSLTGLSQLLAQPLSKSSYETTLQLAAEKMAEQDYYNALEQYEKAYEERKDKELILTIAQLHYFLRDYEKAERWYDRLLTRDKENKYAAERFVYGRVLKMTGKYDEAIPELQRFVNETTDPKLKELAQNEIIGAELAKSLPDGAKGVKVEHAGKDINAPQSEYSPVLYRDGKTLYFAAFNKDDAKEVIVVDDKNKETHHAKIYTTSKGEKGWAAPKVLDDKINRPGFHSPNVAFSADGKRMYFTRVELKGNTIGTSKIYMSEGGDEGWLGPVEVQGVNGEYIAKQPAVGELFGKEVLFFVSNMDSGRGGDDIYYATYQGNGVYSDPVSLGPKINTPGDEVTPYYREGTLYFSSTGHPGIGGFDIFYSVWDGSTWSEPKNMGKQYNTSVDDQYFSMDQEGYNGFFVSNRFISGTTKSLNGKNCCDDIYAFSIAKLYADLVAGVFDIGKKPLKGASVALMEMANNTPGTPDSKTSENGNRFDFGLGLEKAYMIVASHPAYFPDTFQFNTVGLKESKSYEHRFFLKPRPVEPEYDTITKEIPFVLENILYDFDDDRIKPDAEIDLKAVLALMQEYPDMKIEMGSHTDFRGNDAYNLELSQRRAESARRWLMRNEIPRTRIEAKGYGESVPKTVSAKWASKYNFLKEGDVLTEDYINKLATEEQKEAAHSINRRTEFKIIAGPTSVTIKRTELRKPEQPQPNTTTPKTKQAPKEKNSLIQAAPVQHNLDTVKIHQWSSLYGKKKLKGVPIMQFDQRFVELGKVKKGEKRYYTYRYTNRGDTDLKISVITACECTTIDYSTKPIKPGQRGEFKITFDSTEKEESETIDIDIMLENSEPGNNRPIMETVRYKFDLVK
ncbi:MAG: DUF1573 domain-containing protein [Saprospiraceae bacterium]|nr:DUF1573 domain-containing protein [Saprospiraceae bacterium]